MLMKSYYTITDKVTNYQSKNPKIREISPMWTLKKSNLSLQLQKVAILVLER